MRSRVHSGLALLIALPLLGTGLASADEYDLTKDDWPLSIVQRPLTLAAGMAEIRGDTILVNLSDGATGEPVSLAPDVYYGIDAKLTVGVTHIRGVCLTGAEGGCAETYDDVGVDALYGLARGGNLQLAARGGLLFPRLSGELTGGLNVGLVLRMGGASWALLLEPSLYVGALGRDPDEGGGLKETISAPAQIQVQLNKQAAVLLSSGIFGPLDGFGDAFAIPVGLGIVYAVNNRLDVGAEFVLTNVGGKDGGFALQTGAIGAAEAGFDGRVLVGRVALRL